MKVVANRCWGGFGLSHKAVMQYAELAGFELYPFVEKRINGHIDFESQTFEPYVDGMDVYLIHYSKKPLNNGKYEDDSYFSDGEIERNDPILIRVIEELGKEANGSHAELEVVEIPDGIEWTIDDYDGMETVEEAHRSW
jgi:hypothetical protein